MPVTLIDLGWKIAKIHHHKGTHTDRVELINPPNSAGVDDQCGVMWLQPKEAVTLALAILELFNPDAESAHLMHDPG